MQLKIGVICYPTVGGSGIIATELGKMMARRGHTVHFIASGEPFRFEQTEPRLYFHEVKMEHYAVFKYPPYDIALANKIAHVIQQEQLDLLHVHYAVPHAVSATLGKDMAQSSIPMITTLHGTDVTVLGRDARLKDTVRYGIEKSTAVTAVSEALRKETEHLIEPNCSIETIYNFVDETEYYEDHTEEEKLRKRLGFSKDDKVCIHISNFRRVKRTDYIIRSFAILAGLVDNVQLLLVGDGPDRSKAVELAKELQVEDRISFVGAQKEMRPLLSMSDVMFHLSDKEAFGLVILEAFACGVPAIATNIGGIPEVVQHGENGYLVPLDDPELVAAYAYEFVTDDARQRTFSEAAKKTAAQFDSKAIVDQYESLYRKVMK